VTTKSALFLALIAGAIYPLGFAPFGYFSVALLSALVFFLLLVRAPHLAPWSALVFGFGKYLVGISWVYVSLNQYGSAPPLLAGMLVLLFVVVMALFCWPIGLFYKRLHSANQYLNGLVFIALWLVMEWSLTWLFTGFPWLFLGYGAIDSALAGVAPVAGVLATSAFGLVSVVGFALVSLLWVEGQRGRLLVPGLALMVLPWVIGVLLSSVSWVQPIGQYSVALVQGNLDQTVKWDQDEQAANVRKHIELSAAHWDADLVVWSEFAVTLYGAQAHKTVDFLQTQGLASKTNVITGIPTLERLPRSEGGRRFNIYNTAQGYGLAQGGFAKYHLVPFGEFVPLEDWLRGLIEFFNLPMSGLKQGSWQQNNITLSLPPAASQTATASETQRLVIDGQNEERNKVQVAIGICYEIAYGNSMRDRAEEAGVILTISNDTWFGGSIGPHQHMQIARMRALENGRWLLRGTNNGVTAIVNAQGKMVDQLPQFEAAVLRGEFAVMQGRTPYSRVGDWPILLLILLALVSAIMAKRRSPVPL
tara:strand:+ start:386 stop:1984 length:1599 start_codon:yes stop_codon:yes gene_type:complete